MRFVFILINVIYGQTRLWGEKFQMKVFYCRILMMF